MADGKFINRTCCSYQGVVICEIRIGCFSLPSGCGTWEDFLMVGHTRDISVFGRSVWTYYASMDWTAPFYIANHGYQCKDSWNHAQPTCLWLWEIRRTNRYSHLFWPSSQQPQGILSTVYSPANCELTQIPISMGIFKPLFYVIPLNLLNSLRRMLPNDLLNFSSCLMLPWSWPHSSKYVSTKQNNSTNPLRNQTILEWLYLAK